MRAMITAEVLRLRSTRLWLWTLLAGIFLGGSLIGLLGLVGPENAQPPMPGLDDPNGIRLLLGILAMTVFVPAIFGTIAMTSEYRHRTITPTFLFAPRRWHVLAAKLVVFALAGLAYGVVTCAAATGALYLSAALTGTNIGVSLASIMIMMVRIVVAMGVYCLIGVGVGALVRNQVVSMIIVVGYFYMLETLLMLIPGLNLIYPFLPGGATAALTNFTYVAEAVGAEMGTQAVQLLSPALGAGLLLAYAVAAAAAAVAIPLRRDV